MKITRRELPALLLAQAPPIPSTPDEELAAVRAQLQRNSALLDKFPLPMATEPAFQFKA